MKRVRGLVLQDTNWRMDMTMIEAEQTKLDQARDLVWTEAERLGLAPLEEAVKWGQPAFLTRDGEGTTIRLGALHGRPALFVHCQTTVIREARELFGDEGFEGNRACLLDCASEEAILHVITRALTYHSSKSP